jgi:hypothetical protein
MPEISRFLGVSIRMYRDEHLPPRVLGYVIEWASLHENELAQCCEAARSDQVIGKIEPLI